MNESIKHNDYQNTLAAQLKYVYENMQVKFNLATLIYKWKLIHINLINNGKKHSNYKVSRKIFVAI